MDAIRNYLDNMFANLPGTPDVLRAKEELGQMMEDKYTELIEEGKTENEAVGSVISEFGNLSELAEILGLKDEILQQNEENTPATGKILTVQEAADYIKMKRGHALFLSLGVSLCILSTICPILVSSLLPDQYDFFAAAGMFVIVMIGVGLIIYSSIRKRTWNYLRREECTLSMDTTKYVRDEQNRYESIGVAEMIIGIICCTCSWIPSGLIDEFTSYGDSLGGMFFFLMIGIGVFLLIHSHGSMKGYKILLNLNKAGTMKANYGKESANAGETTGFAGAAESAESAPSQTGEQINPSTGKNKKEKLTYISPLAEFFMDVYWPTVICLYLCSSFITFQWGATWAIWPIAGILHGVFRKAFTE